MGLFGKKKEVKEEGCCCGCQCSDAKATSNESAPAESNDGKLNLKVLGSGCKNCHTLYENTQSAVKEMSLDAEVEYITDMEKVMTYGAISMPVLVVNEKVESMGKVLKPADVEKLLNKLGY